MIRRLLTGALDTAVGVAWWFRSLVEGGSAAAFAQPGPDPRHHTPLVILPGIWERWTYLVPLARSLHDAGHPVWLLPTLGANGQPIGAAADVVADFLLAEDLSGVILVGHSKGGLIGKLVMLDEAVADRVRGMVTFGTPFAGSSLSVPILRRSPLGIFAPKGSTIVELAEQQEVNSRIISLQPTLDQMVPEGSVLPGARNVTLEVVGHYRPTRDGRTHQAIHHWLHELEETTT